MNAGFECCFVQHNTEAQSKERRLLYLCSRVDLIHVMFHMLACSIFAQTP